eukprot:3589525-Pleurochrysis_carterae.AAC.3
MVNSSVAVRFSTTGIQPSTTLSRYSNSWLGHHLSRVLSITSSVRGSCVCIMISSYDGGIVARSLVTAVLVGTLPRRDMARAPAARRYEGRQEIYERWAK